MLLARCLRQRKILKICRFSNESRHFSIHENHQELREKKKSYLLFGVSTTVAGYTLYKLMTRKIHAEAPSNENSLFTPPERKDLPTFRQEEVKTHGRNSGRIWGVYDITDFVNGHPGGDKILMAAGGSVDPFWALYSQHFTPEVMEILENLRIGNLDPRDIEKPKETDASDPFSTDPNRHPALIVNNAKPFNAESPPSLLTDHFRTPNDLFFVRNHLPVPKTDKATHKLTVEGLGIKKPLALSVEELSKKYKETYVTSAIQCAGNRRADMNRFKKVQGLLWEGYAISNAKWTGVRLRDVLISLGVDPNDKNIKHVHLEGADVDPTGTPYGASIPFEKAMGPEVIIAYKMNDEEIPKDHGAPLRLIVPGNVGARQVKWLTVIRLSDVESPSHFQQKDYRAFSPAVNIGDELDWSKVPSIQEYPIQCTFCIPASGTTVDREDETVDVAGYAWSGGGRGIIRVEISPDGGKTWQSAELEHDPEQDMEHMWAWTLFRASVKIPAGVDKFDLIVKATDRAYNTQPESPAGIWNVRGLLNNSWHRIQIKVADKSRKAVLASN